MQTDERLNLPSASSMERIALCPGSRTLELSQPDNRSEESDDGEKAHDLAARYFRQIGDDLVWPEFAQELYAGMDFHIAEVVEKFIDMAKQVYAAWKQEVYEAAAGEQWIKVERRFYWLDEQTFKPITSGQPDVVWIAGKHALILDLKSLNGYHTESVRNLQLRTYALVLNYEFGCDDITVAICQPMVSNKPQTCHYKAATLAVAREEIRGYLAASESENAPLLAGPKQCRNCRARAVCPEAGEYAMMPAIVPRRELKKGEAGRIVALLSVEERFAIYENSATIRRILDAVKDNLLDLPADQLAELGWAVETKQGNREVKDGPAAWEALKDDLTPERWNRCCSVGISKIETEFRGATHLPVKEVKAQVEKKLGALILRKADSKELVRLKEPIKPVQAVLEHQPTLELPAPAQ